MPEWGSEIEVGEELARHLIAGRFPELDVRSLWRLGEGWDNTVWVTGDRIAFRFPRRQIAIPGVQREMAILPGLAARLPAPVPDAAFAGAPDASFPWPWFGSRLVDGTELGVAGLPVARRARLATELGRFLRELHGLRPPDALPRVVDPLGRADMAVRVPRAREALGLAAPLWDDGGRAEEILEAVGVLAHDPQPVLVHGDLHLRHALVSESGGLAGVIDWGDMCRAPRSVDLSVYWSLFDAGGRAAFTRAYGPLSEPTLTRARVLALFLGGILAAYGADIGLDALRDEALAGLQRTVTD